MADKVITYSVVIEQIRAAMPIATESKNGLMSSSDKMDQFILKNNLIRDANSITENGIYNFNATGTGAVPINGQQWGIIIHFTNRENNITAQIFISSGNMFAFRQAYDRNIAGVSWNILRNAG